MSFTDHPALRWAAALLTILSLGAGAAGVWWLVYQQREELADLLALAQEIREEQRQIRTAQSAIRADLRLQTDDVDEVRRVQRESGAKLDRQFDRLEDGHDRIVDEVHRRMQ